MAQNKKEEIIEKIVNRGYEIVEERVVKFTPEMAHEFYKHRKDDVGYLRYFSNWQSQNYYNCIKFRSLNSKS